VLWARTVVESEGSTPSWLDAILRKRCPGFAEEAARSNQPELLGFQLLPWVQNQAFAFAKEEGWLDALVFYGFRDARSKGSWEYWEHCESEWKKRRPKSFPTFAEWRRSALSWELDENVPCTTVTKAVEKYLDFEASYGGKSKSWRKLFNWGKSHVLAHAKDEGWLDCVLRHARFHPHHVRLVDYAALWCKSWLGNTTFPYPSLRQWRRDAESYVRTTRS